ncbi:MAG TPA: rhomboid family intramembrane serine protease [Patescibacteria group bacterium]
MFPLRDSNPLRGFPVITLGLILVDIYVFVQQLLAPSIETFTVQYALVPANVNFSDFGSLTPFLTANFLHGGFLHIASNMWFLWIFGDNVEAALGKIKYLFLYLISGILAMLTQYFFFQESTIPMLGASGAVAGVLAGYLILFPRHTIDTLVPVFLFPVVIGIPAAIMIVYWFVIQFFSGITSIIDTSAIYGGVAYWAHIGGFLAGIILTGILKNSKPNYGSN